jgi:hypothetical protein
MQRIEHKWKIEHGKMVSRKRSDMEEKPEGFKYKKKPEVDFKETFLSGRVRKEKT